MQTLGGVLGSKAFKCSPWTRSLAKRPVSLVSIPRQLVCHAASAAGISHGSVDKALAHLHFKLREYSKAVEDVLSALKHHPEDTELYLLLGQAYDQLGMRTKGAQARRKALELEEADALTCSMRALKDAREALESMRCVDAISIATSALDRPETCPSPTLQAELYRVISDSHSLMGHCVEAVEAERIALEACPEHVMSRVLLVEKEMELACAQHDLDQAERLATEGILMCREFGNQDVLHQFFRARGRVLFTKGRLEKALSDFQEYVSLRPNSAEPYLLLSDALSALHRTEESVNAQEWAVRLDPENERAKLVLATRLTHLLEESREQWDGRA